MKNIVKVLQKSNKIAIFVHSSADGDALGSAFALKYMLETNGKNADIYLNETVSERLSFVTKYFPCEYFTTDIDNDYDIFVALDCGDEHRLGVYSDDFLNYSETVNIDHHRTNSNFAKYNYVDGSAPATGELIALLLKEMGVEFDKTIASLLYIAISSDTGCFAYSSVTANTLRLAAELIECGIDSAEINRLLFSTNTLVELKLKSFVVDNLKMFYDGKLAIATVTENDLLSFGASYEHTESLVDILRSIKGVEIGCLIKQKDGKTKGSIRTNSFVDATQISEALGGGGHIRAAGFSTDLSVAETLDKVVKLSQTLL